MIDVQSDRTGHAYERGENRFHIMLCLSMGQDSLFLKYIKRMTTIMAVKDRVHRT